MISRSVCCCLAVGENSRPSSHSEDGGKEKSIRFRGARRRRVTGGHADLNALIYTTLNKKKKKTMKKLLMFRARRRTD